MMRDCSRIIGVVIVVLVEVIARNFASTGYFWGRVRVLVLVALVDRRISSASVFFVSFAVLVWLNAFRTFAHVVLV